MNYKKFLCKFAVASLLFTAAFTNENIPVAQSVCLAAETSDDSLIKKYTEDIRRNPKDIKAYMERGFAYYSAERYNEAISDFSQVIKFEPNNVKAYLQRGAAYRDSEQYDNAIKDFDKAISLDSKNATNYLNRAQTYFVMNNYDKSRADYNTAIRLNPNGYDLELQNTIAELEKLGMSTDFLLAGVPKIAAQAYLGLGLIDITQNNFKSAVENLNSGIKIQEWFVLYSVRSECYKAMGDKKRAAADLKKSKALEKNEQIKLDNFTDSILDKAELDVEDDDD